MAETFAAYAGSESCRECHAETYAAWKGSHHGRAERVPDRAVDGPTFDPARLITAGATSARVGWDDPDPMVTPVPPHGDDRPRRVVRVIGESPLVQFLVEAGNGRLQTLDLSWDPERGEWFNVFGDEDRQPGDWGHWTGRGMNWNAMCAACHNTRLRKNYDAATDVYRTAAVETGVGCEACHGPMRDHVAWRQANAGTSAPDPTVRRQTPDQWRDTCGSCHARRGELTGDFVPGDAFDDHFALVTVDESGTFHPDGQVHEEDYELSAFLGSRMHAAGVRCGDCHDPHAARPRLAGDALCMRCHSGGFPKAPVIVPAAHTFHRPESSGARCTACHMPLTTFMQRHPRHDHGFTVPDPVLTEELGIPNACNRCHVEQDAAWAAGHVARWYGERMQRPARERTRAVAAARRGETAGRDALLQRLGTGDPPYWEAVSARLLARWAGEPPVRRALVGLLDYTNALVRATAVTSLGGGADGDPSLAAALRLRLADPSRNVRVATAWALRRDVDPGSRAGQELAWMLAHAADQPLGQVQLGVYHLDRGDIASALPHFARAVAWDPGSAAVRHEHAVALSLAGRSAEAVRELREAVRLEPAEAEYHFKLGLALNEVGDLPGVRTALEAAVSRDPAHGRAWYNLGLVRDELGDPAGAVEALYRAESVTPGDPAIPYARATVQARQGDYPAARTAARRALEIDPGFTAAAGLLRQLPP